MDIAASDLVRVGTFEELKAKGRLVVRGRHRPILVVHENGHVFALDNRCPHMGFPLDRGSIEDALRTWRFEPYLKMRRPAEIETGLTFELRPAGRGD